MALAADLLGDRWTLLVLREAFYGVQRYDDMQADLGAPRSILTDRLGKMVDRGLLARRPYRDPGRRTRQAYVLTEVGRDVAPLLIALMQWGEDHILQARAPVEIREAATGEPLRLELVTGNGRVVATNAATFAKRAEE
jgi:DNA-binding HxlR family transcriptional regulator